MDSLDPLKQIISALLQRKLLSRKSRLEKKTKMAFERYYFSLLLWAIAQYGEHSDVMKISSQLKDFGKDVKNQKYVKKCETELGWWIEEFAKWRKTHRNI